MADGRRIVFGTQIIAKQSATQEEASISKYTLDHNRTYGGKGVVEIADNQWSDSWTSMAHQQMNWEDWSDIAEHSGNRWEDVFDYWSGVATISAATQLVTHGEYSSTPISFVYIKNLGTTSNQALKISLNAGSNYTLYLKAGASVAFRGDGTNLVMSDLRVDKEIGNTDIEFIIAS